MDFSTLKESLLLSIASSLKGLPNFGTVTKKLSRSAQPNEVGFIHLKELGVDIIFKLDRDDEYSDKKEELNFGGAIFNRSLKTKEVTKEQAINIANELQNELQNNKRVHVHCIKGKDRTGLVIGTWKMLYQNKSYLEIQADWKKYGNPLPNVQVVLKEIALDLEKH